MSENDTKTDTERYFLLCYAYELSLLGMADLSGDKMNMKNAEILEVTAEGDIGKEDEPEGIGRVSDALRHR